MLAICSRQCRAVPKISVLQNLSHIGSGSNGLKALTPMWTTDVSKRMDILHMPIIIL